MAGKTKTNQTKQKPRPESPMLPGFGLMLCIAALLLALSLFSYTWEDISLLKVPANDPPSNLFGPVGAWCAFMHFMILGVGAFLVPLFFLCAGLLIIFSKAKKMGSRIAWMFGTLLCTICVIQIDANAWQRLSTNMNIGPDAGGLFGRLIISRFLAYWLNGVGAAFVMWAALLGCLFMTLRWQTVLAGYRWIMQNIGTVRIRRAAHDEEDDDASVDAAPVRTRRQLTRKPRKAAVADASPPRAFEPERDPILLEDDELEPELKPKRRSILSREPKAPKAPSKSEETSKSPKPAFSTKATFKPKPKSKPTITEDRESAMPGATDLMPPREPGVVPSYTLPPFDLLEPLVDPSLSKIDVDPTATAQLLIDTLSEFGIEGQINNVEVGPVVTSYEVLPAPGVRVERISNLANNLALSLKATSIRVQAPIPGKGVVGIEVPNDTSQLVQIRGIVEGRAWRTSKAALPLVLGKDVGGKDLVVDLAAMPHLLIAGATGAGKTVCMNSILAGLLMSRTPEQMRLMLVDPKIVEFSVYENLPHLVVPVITDAKKVCLGLRWAINEMESRYKLFAKVGVRNIASYNSREIVQQEELFGEEVPAPSKNEPPATVPYIVVVIDELADLMLVDQAGIENSIARLAQLSRAVGIHMIIATQRPSVNVITGTIKANFPGRIAFQVAQRVDSRTILDTVGADKLLGKGDMLFLAPGSSKLMRAQGSMTTDDEILNIANHWRAQSEPIFEMSIKEKLDKPESTSKLESDSGEDDALLEQAIEIIRETRRASTSSLQRRLRIGYTRAARVIDVLEERGILGPPRGSEPREILIDLDAETPDMDDEGEDYVEQEASRES
jgi:DNA segregation ATPase FtsK/SpoIIIE, S-DNA-T family